MNMKTISYVVAAVGVVVLALGVYWQFVKHDHPARALTCLIVGAVLIIAGLVAPFVLKPKTQAA